MQDEVSGQPDASVRLLPLGDMAWTVEFGERIDPALHARVLGLAKALEERRTDRADREFAGVIDVVPTFRSLTVHYNPLASDGEQLGAALLRLAASSGAAGAQGRQWRIPVCFDDEFAPDLADLAEAKGLSRDEVVRRMTEATFQVYMIGFMPGFPYMGGLPPELEVPRLASPRKAVPARSLAIAGAMCAVYLWESPGGWRLLGRTPVPMFSAADPLSPALLASGDRVSWQAIGRPVFLEMEAAVAAGALERSRFLLAPGEH
jgi:KipI family sensor histidine kinase inhibitor